MVDGGEVRQRVTQPQPAASPQQSSHHPSIQQPEVDCHAAAPAVGSLNACHALKLIALTFAVLFAAFSAELISITPNFSLAEEKQPAASRTWKPMAGQRLHVVHTVKTKDAVLPTMDSTPRSEPIRDYGLPKDHPYTPPEARQRTALASPLRTAEYYAGAGGILHIAPRVNATDDMVGGSSGAGPGPREGWPKGVFRTHAADPDPIVVTFDGFLAAEEARAVIDAALPQMRRAGVTADNGGSRHSQGRSNDLTWLPHDHTAVRSSSVQVSSTSGHSVWMGCAASAGEKVR